MRSSTILPLKRKLFHPHVCTVVETHSYSSQTLRRDTLFDHHVRKTFEGVGHLLKPDSDTIDGLSWGGNIHIELNRYLKVKDSRK